MQVVVLSQGITAFMTAFQIFAVGLILPLTLKEVVGSPQQRTEHVQLMCWYLTGLSQVQQHLT
jgi:hypothetical protein